MALTPCTECGKDISDKATACPHCGAPTAAPQQDPFTAAVNARIQAQHRCEKCGTTLVLNEKTRTSASLILTVPMLIVGFSMLLWSPAFGILVLILAFLIDLASRKKTLEYACPACHWKG
jgi:predicted RNA-binding Zn-ribbon protein involved in translation (DUF1610 family)